MCVPITRQRGGRGAQGKELEGILNHPRTKIKLPLFERHIPGVHGSISVSVSVCIHTLCLYINICKRSHGHMQGGF